MGFKTGFEELGGIADAYRPVAALTIAPELTKALDTYNIVTHNNRQIGWYPSGNYLQKQLFKRLTGGEKVNAWVINKGRSKKTGNWWYELKIVVYKQPPTASELDRTEYNEMKDVLDDFPKTFQTFQKHKKLIAKNINCGNLNMRL